MRTGVASSCRRFISSLHESPDLQATILQLCSAGTQGASDLSTVIILAADNATMQPAALSESLDVFYTIVRLCSAFDSEHHNATQTFIENLLAHVLLPSLTSHILDIFTSLPEVQWPVDITDGHTMVLSWVVLLWQCCEASVNWCNTLPAPLSMESATIFVVVDVLLRTASAMILPEVKTIVIRCGHPGDLPPALYDSVHTTLEEVPVCTSSGHCCLTTPFAKQLLRHLLVHSFYISNPDFQDPVTAVEGLCCSRHANPESQHYDPISWASARCFNS